MWYYCRSFQEKPGDEIETILNTYMYIANIREYSPHGTFLTWNKFRSKIPRVVLD